MFYPTPASKARGHCFRCFGFMDLVNECGLAAGSMGEAGRGGGQNRLYAYPPF